MTLLGELYAAGLGVRQDWTRAAEWYRLGADRGDPHAAYGLAMLKLDGRGVPKDAAEARKLLERAADAVPAAAYNLGLMLLGDQKPESDRRAVELFRSAAAALGPGCAIRAWPCSTRQGRGVERDIAEAALWMGRAARERNMAAQVEYAIMLFNGDGVRKDETAAAQDVHARRRARQCRGAEPAGAALRRRARRAEEPGRGRQVARVREAPGAAGHLARRRAEGAHPGREAAGRRGRPARNRRSALRRGAACERFAT